MAGLPAAFLERPIAHRALHDVAAGRPENSRAAITAAISAGYGIEIDLQLSSDGVAMVFHDERLERLTGARGLLGARDAAELSALKLKGADEGIPTLSEVLDLVAGRVPLLIEIKDQDGALGPEVGPLEQATADALRGYGGPVAVMSFNPHAVARMARLAPKVPRGLTTEAYAAENWPGVPGWRLEELRGIPDYARTGACFVSHNWKDLGTSRIAELKDAGAAILCWTIRTPEQEAQARKLAQNVTFEQYLA
ncbi:Glycerophosphoryl diester phosphodiesterase [Alloyangia pacifica]|uniref:Glycerophosphoryl diester phosphodiesterase n=2 Tax=Alloyangia pacifica TaxID=311180 RepID=A0A1I6V6V7_9RHOB|nr:Glycerophosphoryl diester phosphodiesterase [Alloyangia pacifica]SFT09376.1 Glycerophosphoryl diester phosphodiesterase [Alloyangia pacifica]